MIRIDFPPPDFRTRTAVGGGMEIFDVVRRAWVRLSPEEWVRQNFLQWLIHVRHYPASLIAVEKEVMLGELKKKFDILVYDRQHRPWMMIECKAMDVELTEKVLMQVLRYNLAVPASVLVITNGRHCHALSVSDGAGVWLDELPDHA
jgi:hypothetical protein